MDAAQPVKIVFSIEKDPEERRSRFVVKLELSTPETWVSRWFAGLNYTENQVKQSWQWQRQLFSKVEKHEKPNHEGQPVVAQHAGS